MKRISSLKKSFHTLSQNCALKLLVDDAQSHRFLAMLGISSFASN